MNMLFPVLISCALLLPACMPRSPETHYYVLDARPGDAPAGTLLSGRTPVRLDRISLPDYLDRGGIVCRGADGVTLKVAEFHVWAEPLKNGVRRALTETLAPRLERAGHVLLHQDDDGGLRIAVDVLRFEGVQGGAVLDAQFSIEQDGHAPVREHRAYSESCGENIDDLVQAQSRLLRLLATDMAEAVLKTSARR